MDTTVPLIDWFGNKNSGDVYKLVDCEYNPNVYKALMQPAAANHAPHGETY
jgi:hypothetical protein